jgi:hypothetical protein
MARKSRSRSKLGARAYRTILRGHVAPNAAIPITGGFVNAKTCECKDCSIKKLFEEFVMNLETKIDGALTRIGVHDIETLTKQKRDYILNNLAAYFANLAIKMHEENAPW